MQLGEQKISKFDPVWHFESQHRNIFSRCSLASRESQNPTQSGIPKANTETLKTDALWRAENLKIRPSLAFRKPAPKPLKSMQFGERRISKFDPVWHFESQHYKCCEFTQFRILTARAEHCKVCKLDPVWLVEKCASIMQVCISPKANMYVIEAYSDALLVRPRCQTECVHIIFDSPNMQKHNVIC